MDILLPEFKQLLLLLIKHNVKFMLVGGYAVIYYGYERSTGDMDLWLEPTDQNKSNLLIALAAFGIEKNSLDKISTIAFTEPQLFFIGKLPRRVDFLTKIKNVEFEDAFKRVNHFPLSDKLVPIIHYDDLILSKITNNRFKDKADVEELQKIQKFKK